MSQELLYVGNFRGADVSVFDMETHDLVTTIPMVGEADGMKVQPDSLGGSPRGDAVYATRFPDKGDPGKIKERGDVIALDPKTHEMVWRLEVSSQPNHLVVSPDGKRVYVPIRDRDYVEVVDVDSREIVGRAPCGWGPHGTRVSPDGKRLYVGTLWADQLSIIDTESLKMIGRVKTPEAVRPFCVTEDGAKAYVQQSKLHGFLVVDLKAGEIRQTVHMPVPESGFAGRPDRTDIGTVNHGMEMSHDGTLLYAAGSATDMVVVYELPSLDILAQIPVGAEPAWLHLSADGKTLCATNRVEDTVSFIDTTTMTEVAREKAGTYPNRMGSVVVS
ncbi:cytochrome D1 domain-containing protein [Mycobacterium sp. NAZ190054]|uniref:cytochrome D1 domain-containing protein n=1 Tax=Mycobacterium sp. NAZ190054 TaxID=1747766 RepID=UPI000A5433DA|nr:cytochrome D1 domain-containing protein [Mycobacterium sp. NAZ190054]